MNTPRPDDAENTSSSPIGVSLGRLQKLEEDFRQHRDFWEGQAPYMRILLETTQALNQGLMTAVAALDRRQGEAIRQLAERVNRLVPPNRDDPTNTSSGTQATTANTSPAKGQGELLGSEASPPMLPDTQTESIRAMRGELSVISQKLESIARDTADLIQLVYGLTDNNGKD
ncbi:hypothetical protein [Acidithiobacillus sp.]|uniref:hypothetical protein n=1 Tax=Acidithiobacillus sp. TaxID=1872118 RepID=UPI0025C4B334|nr:hypothetical protein [Acidithiobacillus sp.]